MNFDEFKHRTERFMKDVSIESYQCDYEPAYMALSLTDKDEFCHILQDDAVRRVIIEISHEITRHFERHKELCAKLAEANFQVEVRDKKLERMIGAVKLVQATADRALADMGRM